MLEGCEGRRPRPKREADHRLSIPIFERSNSWVFKQESDLRALKASLKKQGPRLSTAVDGPRSYYGGTSRLRDFLIFGEGYLSGALAMGLTITVLILFGIVHPPAVSTSLIFAFRVQQAKTLLVFLMALVMVAVLYVIQRVAVALSSRIVPGS